MSSFQVTFKLIFGQNFVGCFNIIADWGKIRSGWVTDIYFRRALRILESHGLSDKLVRMEAHVYSFPKNWEWGIFAGLEEVIKLLEGRKINLYAMDEGTLFRVYQPLLVIEGPIGEFLELETPILGMLRHSTSVATKAARIKKLAGEKLVLFFGLRSAHPAIAPILDRAAYIGGCDGVSGAFNEETLGIKPTGTMPHTLIILFEDQRKAWEAFDQTMEREVPRIMLVDTFYDERIESLMAAELLKDRLYGVRLDTPSSRRGNMRKIVEEVRWTLDLHGYSKVRVFVSGGIDEEEIKQLNDIVDGFGVGTSIAFPPSIDISMEIIEINKNGRWEPISKRGKWPGMKQVYRCLNDYSDQILKWDSEPPRCRDGSKPTPLLKKYIENGKIVENIPSPKEIRNKVLEQLKHVEI